MSADLLPHMVQEDQASLTGGKLVARHAEVGIVPVLFQSRNQGKSKLGVNEVESQ